jgi:4-amino-4-deoxy-L-arabinose transferase-like glycosyltransferase
VGFQAAKNIALTGRYGLRSTEGFMEFPPAIQTGPTVLFPIAGVFRVGDTGILQARLVTVFYTVLAIAAFYWLVRTVCSGKVAILASALLIFTFDHEFTSFVFMGRQVLAEVPALFFFWLGTLLWLRTWKSSRWLELIWPGLLWGLAMLTKVQFALMLPAALILFWLFDRIFGKKLKICHVLIPILVSGGCVLMWYGYQVLSLGFDGFWQQAMELRAAGAMHFLRFSPRRTISAIFQLLGSSLILFGVPGMLYTVGSGLQSREETGYHQVFLAAFTVVWLGWYAFLSIGWMRYAFVPSAMSTIFVARLLGEMWDWASQSRQLLNRWLPLTPGQVAIGGVVVMLLLSGLIPMAKQIAQSHNSGLQELAHYLNTYIPTDVVIESWEWEVDLLTDHAYHHPPYEVTNMFVQHIWYGTPVSPDLYDPLAFHPMYLIIGPFAKWTGIYTQCLQEQRCTLVESIGEYDLYKVGIDEKE